MALTDKELRSKILGLLGTDATEEQLLTKLQANLTTSLTLDAQITFHARMLTALNTLMFQHRAWKTDAGLWTITDKGKTSHA
tara:strand:- start:68 stop:313 length:246 start_codon:yes stop_codon:yes gene_type:complete